MPTDDILYVIDFDRTLGDVKEVMLLAEQASKAAGIDFDHIKKEAESASASATPYSPLDTITAEGEAKLEEFKRQFVELGDPERLIYPDGRRYLDRLEGTNKQYMILTHAVDERWQQLKLQASRLENIPHIITFNPNKSEDITGWIDAAGKFNPSLEGIKPARQLIFIDDRLRAFEGLPENCQGYYLKRIKTIPDEAELPPQVVRIASFDEIIDKI